MVLAAIAMVVLNWGEAHPGGSPTPPGPLSAKDHAGPEGSAAPQTIPLEPFYLIHEKGAKAWIERIIVTVMVNPGKTQIPELNKPEQRSQIFDVLATMNDQALLPSLIKTSLDQAVGGGTVSSVQLSRSFLVF
jgi:hypothetical protein